jgi:hypothetical protein
MNKFRNALLIISLASMIITTAGCQEKEQANTLDNAGTITEPSKSHSDAPTATASTTSPKIVKTALETKPVEVGKSLIKFDKVVHDFGKIGPSVYVNCEFKFKNTGDGTLKMTRKPKAGCGCTIPKLDKMKYAPGESGVIKVRFHSIPTPGNVTKHITVFSNDPKNPKLDLTIKAEVEIAISTTPKILTLNLKKANAGIIPIVITAKDGKPFSINNFTSTGSVITADFDKTKKATKYTFMAKVDLKKLKTRLNGNIKITIDHPNTKQVLLRYTTPHPYRVTSPIIYLLNPDVNKPEKRTIMIFSNYGKKVEIESIVSDKKCLKVLSQEQKGKSVKLVVEVTPKPNMEAPDYSRTD